eukprot:Awhi_evm2s12687
MDHRGSNHCKILLLAENVSIKSSSCTLLQFMESCFRIKTRKWDKWYELHSPEYACVLFNTKTSVCVFSAGFDHGKNIIIIPYICLITILCDDYEI